MVVNGDWDSWVVVEKLALKLEKFWKSGICYDDSSFLSYIVKSESFKSHVFFIVPASDEHKLHSFCSTFSILS